MPQNPWFLLCFQSSNILGRFSALILKNSRFCKVLGARLLKIRRFCSVFSTFLLELSWLCSVFSNIPGLRCSQGNLPCFFQCAHPQGSPGIVASLCTFPQDSFSNIQGFAQSSFQIWTSLHPPATVRHRHLRTQDEGRGQQQNCTTAPTITPQELFCAIECDNFAQSDDGQITHLICLRLKLLPYVIDFFFWGGGEGSGFPVLPPLFLSCIKAISDAFGHSLCNLHRECPIL